MQMKPLFLMLQIIQDGDQQFAASTVTLEPGLWALDNYGDVLLATILNGKTYTWDSSIAARFTTRASTATTSYITTSAPTASRAMMMSPVTRHLVLFGTETTIADTSTQDDMFYTILGSGNY